MAAYDLLLNNYILFPVCNYIPLKPEKSNILEHFFISAICDILTDMTDAAAQKAFRSRKAAGGGESFSSDIDIEIVLNRNGETDLWLLTELLWLILPTN